MSARVRADQLKPGDVIVLVHGFKRQVVSVHPQPDPDGQISVWLDVDHNAQRPFRYLPSDLVEVV